MNNAAKIEPPKRFLEVCAGLDIDPDEHQLQVLGEFLSLLLEVNKTTNLTAIRDADEAWSRHILESLALKRYLVGVERLVDIGSGGGLPGIPLAIVCSHTQVTLVESTRKKADFIQRCIDELGISNACVVSERAETLAHKSLHRDQYGAATVRAVGSLREILELTVPFLHVEGRLLALKGRAALAEIEESEKALTTLNAEIAGIHPLLPSIEPDLHVVEVLKKSTTDEKYPRKPGMPKKRPL